MTSLSNRPNAALVVIDVQRASSATRPGATKWSATSALWSTRHGPRTCR